MGGQYDYLASKAEAIKSSMRMEEERFFETIEAGIKLFTAELENTQEVFDGAVAFKLYDTYGFPLDLTEDMLREKGITLDIEGFDTMMEAQKAKSKASWKGTGDADNSGDFKELKESFGVNKFVGYDSTMVSAKVLALLNDDYERVETINGAGWVMLDATPFYAQSGGQTGDKGLLKTPHGEVVVTDTQKFLDMNLSRVEGSLGAGERVEAIVDTQRVEIAKHHSATHLLHAALREILGSHIAQAGSSNDARRLRFDFNHPQALTPHEISAVQKWVNDRVMANIAQQTKLMSVDEAKSTGAMALFGEKYGDEVRVVSFGEDSIELCGGTHTPNTAMIGTFLITKESGVSAGVRRIEAICGQAAIDEINALRSEYEDIKTALKNPNPQVGIAKLKEQIKGLKSELQTALSSNKKELVVSEIHGISVIVDEIESGDIKEVIDEAKNKYPKVAIMLFQKKDDKVLIACGSKDTPVKAGEWIKSIAPIVGGGGGGRPDFAQAGGKNPEKIPQAIEESKVYLSGVLEGGN
jgi:alanyl-tRNA synthetase